MPARIEPEMKKGGSPRPFSASRLVQFGVMVSLPALSIATSPFTKPTL